MTVSSRALVELVLLGPTNDRRQLQDSPVLGDVWIAYAMKPHDAIDLLITPHKTRPAGPVAGLISKQVDALKLKREKGQEAEVAYLQGLVAARLFFEELLRVVVPMTEWWGDPKIQDRLKDYTKGNRLREKIDAVVAWAKAETEDAQVKASDTFADFTALDRYVSLAAVILWGATQEDRSLGAGDALAKLEHGGPVVTLLGKIFNPILKKQTKKGEKALPPQVWQVSLNRKAMLALERSVPAVKGDAARTLFNVKCDKIRWAVLDSGIDGSHPVFNGRDGKSRILKAFDFSNIRQIVSLDNLEESTRESRLEELLAGTQRIQENRGQ